MTDDAELRKQGFRPYRKTTITYAKQMPTGFAVRLINGDIIYGRAGDYACVSPENNERWVVNREIFLRTYSPNTFDTDTLKSGSIQQRLQRQGFKPFQKHQVTWAKQLAMATVINTLEGDVNAKAGDYLCVGVEGEQWPQSAARFEANYVRLETV
jgi:hypothetical protein